MLEAARPSVSEANPEARRLRRQIAMLRSQLAEGERLPAYEEAPELYERLDALVVAYIRLQMESQQAVSIP
ncbi:hypothetical protein [Limnochorda pilosa]|uniref:Uncharacterized protein n=1 Tax=Limnochorda pilosa TaxID=1555112 RepID=A0A0K2SG20_LIMPI|nr:hypothetical protein [Limnochorda pilosa]BAS26040.1 hypothetical protein LIP_0183 [Limnochorda pilosa]